jgi:hypothetical protein
LRIEIRMAHFLDNKKSGSTGIYSQLDGPSTVKPEGRFPDPAKCGLEEDRQGGLDDPLNEDKARAYALCFTSEPLSD